MAVECPNCACKHCPASHTYTEQRVWKGRTIKKVRRRRVCRHCGTSFYSVEQLEEDMLREEVAESTTTTASLPLPPAPNGLIPNPFIK